MRTKSSQKRKHSIDWIDFMNKSEEMVALRVAIQIQELLASFPQRKGGDQGGIMKLTNSGPLEMKVPQSKNRRNIHPQSAPPKLWGCQRCPSSSQYRPCIGIELVDVDILIIETLGCVWKLGQNDPISIGLY